MISELRLDFRDKNMGLLVQFSTTFTSHHMFLSLLFITVGNQNLFLLNAHVNETNIYLYQ